MEKILNSYDKEYMKMAMLKQEEIFREQVYELHRLYQVQKMVMRNIANRGSSERNQQTWNSTNGTSFNQIGNKKSRQVLDLEQAPADEESDDNNVLEIEDENEMELTLGPTSYYRRRKAKTPLTSDSGLSFSSSSSGSNCLKRRTSSMTDARRPELSRHKWGMVQVPHDQPPGILHVLSLNMT